MKLKISEVIEIVNYTQELSVLNCKLNEKKNTVFCYLICEKFIFKNDLSKIRYTHSVDEHGISRFVSDYIWMMIRFSLLRQSAINLRHPRGMQTRPTQAKMDIDIFDRANETHGPRLRSIDRSIGPSPSNNIELCVR